MIVGADNDGCRLSAQMTVAGVILCGGLSTRMGLAKPTLPFGQETLLARVVRIVGSVARPVIVVAAAEQEIPPLSRDVKIVRDRQSGRGPLEGLCVGLSAVEDKQAAAYVSGCDTPLLAPAFIRRMAALLEDHQAAVPFIDGRWHPLAAVYRPSVVVEIESLLAEDRFRLSDLCERLKARRVTADELCDVDPELRSLRNLNSPDEYLAALAVAGCTASPEVIQTLRDVRP
ncbi:MAG: molybdenum cofactor guanylyltransferase [Singulisphaera sp.]